MFGNFRKKELHACSNTPEEMKRSMFADTTMDYVSPAEPQPFSTIRLRFRIASGQEAKIYFVCGQDKILMKKERSDKYFDFYGCEYDIKDARIDYYYEISCDGQTYYYDTRGTVEKPEALYNFKLIPGFSTPSWAKGAVFYQIYVDRFCNGDKDNDVLTGEYKYIDHLTVKKEDWNEGVSETGIGEFYGGDLAGVLQKMDYLQELGVEVIYFNPLFVSPSNHKYDIQDYDHIDPHFGKLVHDEGTLLTSDEQENKDATRYIDRVTNPENLEASDKLFIELVKEAHKRGMKVILDGVFNHCGSFNKWMDRERIYENTPGAEKGAYITPDSKYRNYFYYQGEDPASYEGWWDYATLPKLNYETQELYDYIMYIARKWVSEPFNVDGWRLDVAADVGKTPELNHKFWQDFRKNVKEANPNALILAEHYGDPAAWLKGNEWDSVMNYDAFMEPITWFLTGMQKHSDDFQESMLGNADAFWNAMYRYGTNFTNSSLLVAMNELSNHDHSRFLTRTNHKVGRITTLGAAAADEGINKAVMREAVLMQMTWPGAPTVYYGDEAGVCGFTDPDNRRTYPWGKEDQEMIAFHKDAIRIHKENEELKTGSLIRLASDYNLLSYGRMKGEEVCVILVNNNDHEITRTVSVWETGILKDTTLKRILFTTAETYTTKEETIPVKNGEITVTLPKTSAMILKYRPKKKFLLFH
ncbi:MAG: glycoside hydrolase family 13 protein [Lachnospiraceae bacterium]|nr:glycoside hydrolase family 13 protein [Lachnospiraceae bacterium]